MDVFIVTWPKKGLVVSFFRGGLLIAFSFTAVPGISAHLVFFHFSNRVLEKEGTSQTHISAPALPL